MVVDVAVATRTKRDLSRAGIVKWSKELQARRKLDEDAAAVKIINDIVAEGNAKEFLESYGPMIVKEIIRLETRSQHPADLLADFRKEKDQAANPNRPQVPDNLRDWKSGRIAMLNQIALEGVWRLDGKNYVVGDMDRPTLKRFAAFERKTGTTRLANAKWFERLHDGIADGEVVRDKFGDNVMTLYDLSAS